MLQGRNLLYIPKNPNKTKSYTEAFDFPGSIAFFL
jgi:hypothetical protein